MRCEIVGGVIAGLAPPGEAQLEREHPHLAALRAGAAQADAVIHLAFGSDYSTPEALARSIKQDTAAIQTLGDELRGTDRALVRVSGTPWLAGRPSTEQDPLPTDGPVGGRGRAVNAALALSSEGVRTSAVRMPRTFHNEGKGGFAGILADTARRTGVCGYPGDGTQRWPAVHALDAAVLFRLALENAAAGTSWHAVADEGDRVHDIATVIGRRLGVPVGSVSPDTYGPFGPIFAADQPASSTQTRAALDWQPTHPSLLDDLDNLQP